MHKIYEIAILDNVIRSLVQLTCNQLRHRFEDGTRSNIETIFVSTLMDCTILLCWCSVIQRKFLKYDMKNDSYTNLPHYPLLTFSENQNIYLLYTIEYMRQSLKDLTTQ